MADPKDKGEENRPLITDADCKEIKFKFDKSGILGPRMLAILTVMDIARKLDVTLIEAEKISRWSIRKLEDTASITKSFSSAEDFCNKKKGDQKLKTGCSSLDRLLGGGIRLGELIEFYGPSGVGKTQLCYNLSTMAQQPEIVGGLDGKLIYIDTEGKFSHNRITQIAEARNFNTENILKNIIFVSAINRVQQEIATENIAPILEKDNKIKLVIIDSIINHYRKEFVGRGSLSERQARLKKSLRLLSCIARLYDVAIVMTNQVSTEPDAFSYKPFVPAGGIVLANANEHRIELRRIGTNIHAEVVTSAYLPCLEARFSISIAGIVETSRSHTPGFRN